MNQDKKCLKYFIMWHKKISVRQMTKVDIL